MDRAIISAQQLIPAFCIGKRVLITALFLCLNSAGIVWATSTTLSLIVSDESVNFGSVTPVDSPHVYAHGGRIQVFSGARWNLTVQAQSDLIAISEEEITDKERNEPDVIKRIPIRRLQWRPYANSSAEWISFQTEPYNLFREQPETGSDGQTFDHNYRLEVAWTDEPSLYQTTLVYTLTASIDEIIPDEEGSSPQNDDANNASNPAEVATIQGRIFDRSNHEALPNAKIILYSQNGQEQGIRLSDQTGSYQFDDIRPGKYYIHAHLDYYYSKRTGGFQLTARQIFTQDIDLQHNTSLFVTKQADAKIAEIGDVVEYRIHVRNIGTGSVFDVHVLDKLPQGFIYLKDTARPSPFTPPEKGTASLHWRVGNLSPGDSALITYHIRIGVNARYGDGKNVATAYGDADGKQVQSTPASAIIKVREGVFREAGSIIGKVYNDRNENGMQDAGEEGVEKAHILMENGSHVITDYHGRYSIPWVRAGNHLLLLDRIPLLKGINGQLEQLVYPVSMRRFAVVFPNETTKVNFGVKLPPEFYATAQSKGEHSSTHQTNTPNPALSPPNPPFRMIALVEGDAKHHTGNTNQNTLSTAGRLALHTQGTLFQDYRFAATIDSAKSSDPRLIKVDELKPYYPTYGDDSTLSKPGHFGKFRIHLTMRILAFS